MNNFDRDTEKQEERKIIGIVLRCISYIMHGLMIMRTSAVTLIIINADDVDGAFAPEGDSSRHQ